MKSFFEIGNRYMKNSDWKDLALIKFCLFSMGVLIGVFVPKQKKWKTTGIAGAVFVAAYLPLMAKLRRMMNEEQGADGSNDE